MGRGFNQFLKRKTLRFFILNYYRNQPKDQITEEIREVLEYLKRRPINIFPYKFKDKYKARDIDVELDTEHNLYYSIIDEKNFIIRKLEFNQKPEFNLETIVDAFLMLALWF